MVSPDTQAALLLCGIFAKDYAPETKPLTPSEYNALVAHLTRLGKCPADLLQSEMPIDDPSLPAADRVRALLARGVEMATALERWQQLGLCSVPK